VIEIQACGSSNRSYIIVEYDEVIGSVVWIQMRVGLWLGVRINTGGCEGSLFITMHTGLDRI
jgi:hypothetical protein